MNERPIETAQDADLRQSQRAMQRAALRAREIAARTGTAIVISRRGVVEEVRPDAAVPAQAVEEPPAAYDDNS